MCELLQVTFESCVQAQAAAIIVNASSNATIYNSQFLSNTGADAGGIAVQGESSSMALPSEACRLVIFTQNAQHSSYMTHVPLTEAALAAQC